MPESPSLYSLDYYYYFPNSSKLIWILKEGMTISIEGQLYRVDKVVRSPIPGSIPSFSLEKLD